ncbi:MAG: diacylglycerol kinase family lipid kinase [Caulobacterales bacterium]|nr:diacylglycerol kinase family lipid kinase [Caulobacterales bacterium]
MRKVEVVANIASGSVGPGAPDEVRAILAEFGLKARVLTPQEDGGVDACLKTALAARPDLLIVLAGDGTARAAAEQAGPRGPLIAPLPGGTMNMLPHAIYGERRWPDALRAILTDGVEKRIAGGEVDGRLFFVAAILGQPALWADAREAMREGDIRKAWLRGRRALSRAFTGRLRFSLDGKPREKAEALTLLCPLVSTAMADDEGYLEAAAIDPADAREAFRLGVNALAGRWRRDPSVSVDRCKRARVWAGGRIPALLDGESIRLGQEASIRYRPNAFRALAPAPTEQNEDEPKTPFAGLLKPKLMKSDSKPA